MINDKCYLEFKENDTFTLNFIDRYFKNFALSLNAKEYYIPTMIHREILEKCGYLKSYPQHISAVAHINEAFYDKVLENQTVTRDQVVLKDYFLTPAVCLHIYPMFEGEVMNDTAITFFGRAYRYENGRFDGSTRLWDYAIREIVFIGSPEYVKNKLQEMINETKKFVNRISLPCNIMKAHDHFYPSKKNKLREKIQIVNRTKDELITCIDEKDIAITSFNYHGTHFSKAFHFDNQNSIVTGCVGYGLERWVAAINKYNIELKNILNE